MADSGFPGQHTTATTTVTNTAVQTNLRYDPSYFRTIPGALKIAQVILNIIGIICIYTSAWWPHSRGGWFTTVAMTGFWFSGILLVFYVFHVIEKFYRIPWLKIEFVFCAVWTFFYLIAASLAADWGRLDEAFGAAAFFGFVAMIAYGYDAFLKFVAVRRGDIAQGERSVVKTNSPDPPPPYPAY